MKPEECNVKINLICQFSFSCFGQQDDGDVTYFAASLHIACEVRRSKRGYYVPTANETSPSDGVIKILSKYQPNRQTAKE